jgi:hypothetical protein
MENVIACYLEEQKEFPNELTSFLRLSVMEVPTNGEYDDYPVYASGVYHGKLEDLMDILEPLQTKTDPHNPHFFVRSMEGFKNNEILAFRYHPLQNLNIFCFTNLN